MISWSYCEFLSVYYFKGSFFFFLLSRSNTDALKKIGETKRNKWAVDKGLAPLEASSSSIKKLRSASTWSPYCKRSRMPDFWVITLSDTLPPKDLERDSLTWRNSHKDLQGIVMLVVWPIEGSKSKVKGWFTENFWEVCGSIAWLKWLVNCWWIELC